MIGKIINGAFISPSLDERKKIVIANPTDEQLKFVMGYKDVIADEELELTDEKQYLIPVYEDAGEIILQHWEIGEYDEEEKTEKLETIVENINE